MSTLNDAAATLANQRELRVAMEVALREWEGGFRTDFDGGYTDVMAAATSLQQGLATRAASIVDSADEANEAQVRHNLAVDGQ